MRRFLSEIALLADDIGIIDHGALLEEESLAELEESSSGKIRGIQSDCQSGATAFSHLSVKAFPKLSLPRKWVVEKQY